ncbi:MAG: purine-nucleoside phosphorylase [Chitinophagaceae bacterium]|nr:purine-nucleoside phosphorylase [Chitinophagaceae bacterium]MBP6476364.1 purine-nucleoside phosphorylase [Chitinophagaceae bacterium]MBP7106944.1 purine-nucleoside phosphorylase [Chitinophagaceae bacterium]MBP7315891.1 purine-nucleoside phosphorylase [Chitinophagaceae bacterium]HQX97428.1 purine-nucleoside phosphorylase [Chitinophagaceae bacterium]
MSITPELVTETSRFLKKEGFNNPVAGIIMGTGLGAMADKIENPIIIPYSTIPNFPEATVEFHKGNLIFGAIGNTKVMAMQGRFHYYEGYSMQQITFPVRVMKELGVQVLFLSNAAGGMNTDYKKGDLVMIEDHINLLPDNPLRGLSDPAFGQRFVDMSQPYDIGLMELISQHANQKNITIKKGTYVSVMGPNLETRAEYRWLRSMGADMVGMSTVPEVIVANQIGIKCAAVSVITDECDPNNLKPINIPEIIEIAGKADQLLSSILVDCIKN